MHRMKGEIPKYQNALLGEHFRNDFPSPLVLYFPPNFYKHYFYNLNFYKCHV